jgi:hypothetical protein
MTKGRVARMMHYLKCQLLSADYDAGTHAMVLHGGMLKTLRKLILRASAVA